MLIGLKNIRYELERTAKKVKPFPHILFIGPRGAGKTTLSKYLGSITEQRFIELNAPALDKQKLYQVLLGTKKGDMIFIDEIHRLSPAVEEILYQPMEGLTITLPFKNRVITTKFPEFSLVGATTRPGLISKPLMSRFKITIDIPPYNTRELAKIIMTVYKFSLRECLKIASYVSVPREALALAERIYGLDMGVEKGLAFLNLREGLSALERSYLKSIQSGPTSLNTIASYLVLEQDSITTLEARLLKLGLVEIRGRGREITLMGLQKLNRL